MVEFTQRCALGIDLGTSNSVIYQLSGSSQPKVVTNNGDRTTPSIVSFGPDIKIGKAARNAMNRKNYCTVQLAKYIIGKEVPKMTPEARESVKNLFGVPVDYTAADNIPRLVVTRNGVQEKMRAEQISAYVLKALAAAAREELKIPDDFVCDVVVSVPARFTNMERQATKDACKIAGLNCIRIVNEPTAAIMCANYDKLFPEPTGTDSLLLMVVDFGGGTLDISIGQQHPDELSEINLTDGDTMLGGSNVTEAVAKDLLHIFVEMNSEFNANTVWKNDAARKKLVNAAEDAKITLNSRNTVAESGTSDVVDTHTEVYIENLIDGVEFSTHYTLQRFNKCFEPFSKKIEAIIKRMWKEKNYTAGQFAQVLLVGGSCRIKAIKTMLKNIGFMDHQINQEMDLDECVAKGACIIANMVGKYVETDRPQQLLLDCIANDIRIRVNEDEALAILTHGRQIPCKESKVFTTSANNQSAVTIYVCEGSSEIASRNHKLGQTDLTGIQNAPRGVPQIEVTFEVDANNLLKVSALDKSTNASISAEMKSSSMSPDEIQKSRDAHEANAEQEKKIVALLRLKSEKLYVIDDMLDKIGKHKDHPKFAEASSLLETNKSQLMALNTSNIAQKDEGFFNRINDEITTNEAIKEIMEVAGGSAAGPDINNNMPGGMPTAAAAASEPNVEEAD